MTEVKKVIEPKKKLCARMQRYAMDRDRCLQLALEESGADYLEEMERLPEPKDVKCKCKECSPDGNAT